MNKFEKGYKLYRDYSCSYFFMEKEGVLKKYSKLKIPKDIEVQWEKEYLSSLLEDMRGSGIEYKVQKFDRAIELVIKRGDEDNLNNLLDELDITVKETKNNQCDMFSCVLMCEQLIESLKVDVFRKNKKLRKRIIDSVVRILDEIYHEKIVTVNSIYYDGDDEYLKSDVLKKRIRNDLIKIKKLSI